MQNFNNMDGFSNANGFTCYVKYPFDKEKRQACRTAIIEPHESIGALDDSDVGTNPNKAKVAIGVGDQEENPRYRAMWGGFKPPDGWKPTPEQEAEFYVKVEQASMVPSGTYGKWIIGSLLVSAAIFGIYKFATRKNNDKR